MGRKLKKILSLALLLSFLINDPSYALVPELALSTPVGREKIVSKLKEGSRLSYKKTRDLETSPLVFSRPDNPFKRMLESDSVKEVHIITAGGGGDILGGADLALKLKNLLGEKVKVTVFTSNLKRGEENPAGGPLPMHQLCDSDGNPIKPVGDTGNFYVINDGLRVKTPIKDALRRSIKGYTAPVELSDGKIIRLLKKSGIDVLMADVSKSGTGLAGSYMRWQKGNYDKVFVIGLDMGGDILARFPGPIEKNAPHPEDRVRSPNTDAVFLDMFRVLEGKREMKDRVLLGVSALGGDGEMKDTLLGYLRDYYKDGQVEAVLDNVRFTVERDPQGNRYRELLESCLKAISSEVSGNFLMRLFAAARVMPMVSASLINKDFAAKTAGWSHLFSATGHARGFKNEELLRGRVMCAEMPPDISQKTIRNGTRTEVLPWAYSTTVFMRPSAVTGRIAPKFTKKDSDGRIVTVNNKMTNTDLGWYEKDSFLRSIGYITEMTDPNNVNDRDFINEYLLKMHILDEAFKIQDRGERIQFIKDEFARLLRGGYCVSEDAKKDLSSLYTIWGDDFNDNIVEISHKLGFSEDELVKFSASLRDWLKSKEAQVKVIKSLPLYVYAYFSANMLKDIADFIAKHEKSPSIDIFMRDVNKIFEAVEKMSRATGDGAASSLLVENIIPAILSSSATEDELAMKMKVLQVFSEDKLKGGMKSWISFHFVEFVMPGIFSQKYQSEEHLYGALSRLHAFASRIEPKKNEDGTVELKDSARLVIYENIFGRLFAKAMNCFHSNEELDRIIVILERMIDKAEEDSSQYSHFLCTLDFLSEAIDARRVTSIEEMDALVHNLDDLTAIKAVAGKDISPVLRLMIRMSQSLSTFEDIEEMIGIFTDKIKKGAAYDQYFVSPGSVYAFAYRIKIQIRDVMDRYQGRDLLRAVEAIDFGYSNGSSNTAELDMEFDAAEREAFDEAQAAVKREIQSSGNIDLGKLNHLRDVASVTPIDNFPSADKISDEFTRRGVGLLNERRCAFGVSAGLVSFSPNDYFSVDFAMDIPHSNEPARRLIEWKLHMLDLVRRLHDIKRPIPVVVMTGFSRTVGTQLRDQARSYGYVPDKDLIFFQQGPTKIMDESTGQALTMNGRDLYTTSGAWGFIKWLVLSGKLKELKGSGVKYLTHSNVNNPIERLDPKLLGYFDDMVENAGGPGNAPICLFEVGDYREERGGTAVEIKYKNGKTVSRIVHQDRWPEDLPHGSTFKGKNNYSFANCIINIDGLWDAFGLEEFYKQDGQEQGLSAEERFRRLARHELEIESKKGVEPVLRRKSVTETSAGAYTDYVLDDLTLMGKWEGVRVDRNKHFISIKGMGDAYDHRKRQIMQEAVNSLNLEVFRAHNRIVGELEKMEILNPFTYDTTDSIREKIIKMFLPNRVFEEDQSLAAPGYKPGPYLQKEIAGLRGEQQHNMRFREQLIRDEIGALCRISRDEDKISKKEKMITRANELKEMVFDLETASGERLGDVITNAESNTIVRQCAKLAFYGNLYKSEYNPFADVNSMMNDIAVKHLTEAGANMSYAELIDAAVASVGIKFYFKDRGYRVGAFDSDFDGAIDRAEKVKMEGGFKHPDTVTRYISAMTKGERSAAYLTDDNGEIVYHLYLIQKYLTDNPQLKITLIPRGGQYGVDASYRDVMQLLELPIFGSLKGRIEEERFTVAHNSPRLEGIDLTRISPEIRKAISSCDFITAVGLMNYEMLNGIRKDSYHLLMVHGETSIFATGQEEGTYLLKHHRAGEMYLNTGADQLRRRRMQLMAIEGLSGDAAEEEVKFTEELFRVVPDIRSGAIYEIAYDTARLSPSQVKTVEAYIDFIKSSSVRPENIRKRPFSSAFGSKESLIMARRIGPDGQPVGEGRSDVVIEEGEHLNDYPLKIASMLNISLASANIPEDAKNEDPAKYFPIVEYIQTQYRHITGTEFPMPDAPEDVFKALRYIVFNLPRAMRVDTKKIEDYNKFSKEAFDSAA